MLQSATGTGNVHMTTPQTLPSLRASRRGAITFLVCTLLGIGLIVHWHTPPNLWHLLRAAQWGWFVLAGVLMVLDFLFGALRMRVLLNGRVLPHVSLWHCLRATWANLFLSAVTPFQTGGGPAQIWILWRNGVPIAQATMVAMINLLATLTFFIIAGTVAVLFLPGALFGPGWTLAIRFAFLIAILVTALFIAVLAFPRFGLWVIHSMTLWWPTRWRALRRLRARVLTLLQQEIALFQHSVKMVLRHRKTDMFWVFMTTCALYLNKYMIGYCIARALHQSVGLGVFLMLQIIQWLVIYFAPTPGASGMAEVSAVLLMQQVLARETLVLFAILWRGFTSVIGAVLGMVVLFQDISGWITDWITQHRRTELQPRSGL